MRRRFAAVLFSPLLRPGRGTGRRGGGGGVGEGERENGVKRAQNDITFIHRFPRSPLIFRVQISLCLTLYLGRGGSGYHTLLPCSPLTNDPYGILEMLK